MTNAVEFGFGVAICIAAIVVDLAGLGMARAGSGPLHYSPDVK